MAKKKQFRKKTFKSWYDKGKGGKPKK